MKYVYEVNMERCSSWIFRKPEVTVDALLPCLKGPRFKFRSAHKAVYRSLPYCHICKDQIGQETINEIRNCLTKVNSKIGMWKQKDLILCRPPSPTSQFYCRYHNCEFFFNKEMQALNPDLDHNGVINGLKSPSHNHDLRSNTATLFFESC